jgi:hypothetical protein
MGTNLDELKAVKKQINDLKKDAAKKVKELFHVAVAELFKENPKLTSISWTQYTPYFNDGDTCEFSSGHDYCDINGVNEDDWEDEDEDEEDSESEDSELPEVTEAEMKVLKKVVSDFMKHWDDDDMYDLFGDHVQVTVTAKGIETEDYEHE